MAPRLLLLTPPFVQTNTPYPATMHLTGFLRGRGFDVFQRDLSIKVVRDILIEYGGDEAEEILELLSSPQVPDDDKVEASRLIDELAIEIRDQIDESFGFSRYAERISAQASDFGEIEKLVRRKGVMDKLLERRLKEAIAETNPTIIGVTCPFPGTLVGAFKVAKYVRRHHPDIRLVLGGGFVSTELREMSDPRPHKYFDDFIFDEGYAPMLALLASSEKGKLKSEKVGAGAISNPNTQTPKHPNTSPVPPFVEPSYDGIDWSEYFDVVETENPMHRLWSVGKWRKLQMARGCYWHRCAFCDVILPYINCFEQPSATQIVDAMEVLGARCLVPGAEREVPGTWCLVPGAEKEHSSKHQVPSTRHQAPIPGFHFVDEAMPPALIRKVSEEILRRGLRCEWWGNIRFDLSFTPELCKLMAKAGCIAVTGGLECADDRLLKLMSKGITLASAKKAMTNLHKAGIMVHAYLMYGFPTETEDEAYGALEFVRGLFKKNLLQSAFWHRFALTVHSPIAKDPSKFGIEVVDATSRRVGKKKKPSLFCRNEIPFTEPGAPDWDSIGEVLKLALYNFLEGRGLDKTPADWKRLVKRRRRA